jgi:hypothetical protein
MKFDSGRLPDGGPIYVETPKDLPLTSGQWRVAEPWNALSAALFALLAVSWLRKLRRDRLPSSFLTACMALLLVGGVGGTLYHGTRASKWFFLMDVGPIFILVAMASLWLWRRAARTLVVWVVLAVLGVAQTGVYLFLPANDAVNTSYILLAAMLFIPLWWNLRIDGNHGIHWVILAFGSFFVAFMFRVADAWGPEPFMPMGTHWLWHVFGCVSCGSLIKYLHSLMVADAVPALSKPRDEHIPSHGEAHEVA